MTQATNTTLGEIKLAGDLAGNNNALAPELTASGVTAGAYSIPKITVDSKGRVTAAEATPIADLLAMIPDATTSTKGVVKVGTNINVTTTGTSGSQTVNFGGVLVDGSEATGLCTNGTNYTFTLFMNGQTYVNVSIPGSSAQTFTTLMSAINAQITPFTIGINAGNLRIISNTTGSVSKVEIQNDLLFQYCNDYVGIDAAIDGMGESTIWLNDASAVNKGVIKVGNGLSVSSGVLSFSTSAIADATTSTKGVVQIGSGISVASGVISTTAIPDATTSSKGVVQVGTNINVASGVISVPAATTTTPGAVIVGNGLSVSSGIISLDSSTYATSSTPGVVKIGSGLSVSSGVISVNIPTASASVLGAVKIGSGISIDGGGVISATPGTIADATTSTKGVVQIGTNIDVASGVISVKTGTGADKGILQVGTNIDVASGVISVKTGSGTDKGILQVGTNIDVASGVISVPDATTSVKGVVQIGSGLNVVNGIVNIADATTSTKGVVKIGSGIDVSSSTISIADATTSTKGVVQIGTNINVASGVISVPDASYSVKGVARIGTVGISVTSGVIDGVKANSTTTYGVVKSADTNNITITSGDINVGTNIPKKNSANTYSKAQVVAVNNPIFNASMTLDFSLSNTFAFIPTSNFTLNNPTNISPGGIYHIIVKQDATGGRSITWGSYFKFIGVGPAIDISPNKTTIISCLALSSTELLTQVIGGY